VVLNRSPAFAVASALQYSLACRAVAPREGGCQFVVKRKLFSARALLQRMPATAGKLSNGQAFQQGRRGDRSPIRPNTRGADAFCELEVE